MNSHVMDSSQTLMSANIRFLVSTLSSLMLCTLRYDGLCIIPAWIGCGP